MLGKRLKSFSKFILERADWNLETQYKKYLVGKIPGEDTLLKAIKDLDETLNHLEDKYWYNREGRDFHHDHYALDMKIYEWPDLEIWAQARGYTQEEIDGDDGSLEEKMHTNWARFMEETFEDYSSHYEDSFSWLRTVGVGGKSGGWLLLAPDTTHNDVVNHVEEALDEYLTELGEVSEDPELLKILQSDDDIDVLASLGMVDPDQIEAVRLAADKQDDVLTSIYDEIRRLDNVAEDLEMVKQDIQKFRVSCKRDFYTWVEENFNRNWLKT